MLLETVFSTSEVIETFKKILIENGKTDIEVDAIFTTSVKSLYSNTYVDGSGTLPEHIKLRKGITIFLFYQQYIRMMMFL